MKFLKKIGWLFVICLGVYPQLSFAVMSQEDKVIPTASEGKSPIGDNEKIELRKFADQLIGTLDPNMSMEEKQKLVDQTVDETIKLDSYMKSLSPEEREAKEKEMEDAVSYLLSPESPLKDLFEEKEKEESKEEVKKEEPEQKPVVKEEVISINKDAKSLKELLESLVTRIDSLIIKTKSLPRVSSEQQIESKWNKLKCSLLTFESAIKILIKKDRLLNILTTKEYKELKDSITNFKAKLSPKEINFKVPDTAGLTIIYDEDSEDNIEFEVAQKALKEIILIVDNFFNSYPISKNLLEFLKKNAVEELKNNPGLEKDLRESANDVPQSSQPSDQGYNSPRYDRNDRSYSPPYYSGGDYRSDYPRFNFPIINDNETGNGDKNKPSDKPGDRKGDKKEDSDKKRDEKGTRPDSNKDTDPKKGDKKDDKPKSFDKQLDDFKQDLSNLSNTYKRNSELIEELKKESEAKSELNARDFTSNLSELEINYTKTLKTLNRLTGSLKTLQQDAQEIYKKSIKGVYCDPSLDIENNHKKLAELQSEENNQLPEAVSEKINSLISSHSNLKEALEVESSQDSNQTHKDKTPKRIDQFKKIKESLNDISESYSNIEAEIKDNNIEKISTELNEMSKSYANTINAVKNTQEQLSTVPAIKEAIRSIYCDVNDDLQNKHDALIESLSSSNSKAVSSKINELIVLHKELTESFSFDNTSKKNQDKEQLEDLE